MTLRVQKKRHLNNFAVVFSISQKKANNMLNKNMLFSTFRMQAGYALRKSNLFLIFSSQQHCLGITRYDCSVSLSISYITLLYPAEKAMHF